MKNKLLKSRNNNNNFIEIEIKWKCIEMNFKRMNFKENFKYIRDSYNLNFKFWNVVEILNCEIVKEWN